MSKEYIEQIKAAADTMKSQMEAIKTQMSSNIEKQKEITESRVLTTSPGMPFRMPSDPPKFLIFKESIYNTRHILAIGRCGDNKIKLVLSNGLEYIEEVNNGDETWKKFQNVFTYGVGVEDNENFTNIVQENGKGSDSAVADNSRK